MITFYRGVNSTYLVVKVNGQNHRLVGYVRRRGGSKWYAKRKYKPKWNGPYKSRKMAANSIT